MSNTNAVSIFDFKDQKVEVISINGEPHFIGSQIANILGYTNPQKAVRDHIDAEDKLTERIVLAGQNREVTLINESGLYSLILSSKLESAKEFKRWVTSEVLPSIRKTGKYEVKQSREALIANALIAAKEVINELLPKAKAYDAIINKFDSVSWRDFCNKIRDTFGVKENEIREKLIAEHWIYKTNTLCGKTKYKPYKETIDRDLMIVKDVLCNDGEVRPANFFTYKGQQQLIDWFAPVVVD